MQKSSKWPSLLSKPEYAQCIPIHVQQDLDALEELIPIPYHDDRYVAMASWLRNGAQNGLIDETAMRIHIGPNM